MYGFLIRHAHHMCPHREWFDTYENYNGVTVIGNNSTCNTVGACDIKVKIYDGMVRTLMDIWHVSELKDLISLGALESAGCKFVGEGAKLKVMKGALVYLRGERRANLYRLIASTITGEALIGTIEKQVEDTSKLWYMRLGQMDEGGLRVLNVKKLVKGVKDCKLQFCKFCAMRKQHNVSFSTLVHKSKGLLDYIHSNV